MSASLVGSEMCIRDRVRDTTLEVLGPRTSVGSSRLSTVTLECLSAGANPTRVTRSLSAAGQAGGSA
eukprot:7902303-Alexandrium_andersonii.AAC.1